MPVVVGLGLMAFGGLIVWGGISGRLGNMLAAVFHTQLEHAAATAPGSSASANPTPQAAAGAAKYGLTPGQMNTTDPNKPIFVAPSGQPVSGYVEP